MLIDSVRKGINCSPGFSAMLRVAALSIVFMAPLAGQDGITQSLPSFDLASVKPAPGEPLETMPRRSGGRITWTTDLWYLIGYSYHLSSFQMPGRIPGSDSVYRVEGLTSPDTPEDQVRLMFQRLLTDRFKLATHRGAKESDAYVLSVSRTGIRLKEVGLNEGPKPLPDWFDHGLVSSPGLEGKVISRLDGPGVGSLTGRRVTMLQICEALQRVLQSVVTDQTGLRGNYYFGLRYAVDADHPADNDLPSLVSAFSTELGLRLERRKSVMELLFVDHIEKIPTEN